MKSLGFLYLIFFLTFNYAHTLYKFKTVYQWSQIEYEFESENERAAAIANGTFKIGTIRPMDAQFTNISPKDGTQSRYFVSTPRLTPTGVPFTLSVITNKTINGNPVIRPYPHWSWQINPESCNERRIVSASRIWADECKRLWILDRGYVGRDLSKGIRCNPQILSFDLVTDELIHKYDIPQSFHNSRTLYTSLTAEVLDKKGSCLDTWLYVAEPVMPSLLVYSLKLNQFWRVKDASFEPSKNWTNFTADGDKLTVNFGISTLALSPPSDGDKRKLAYHAMASMNESYVYTKELRNINLLENGGGDIFHTYPHPRNQLSGGEAYDRRGRLHFSLLSDITICRWNSKTEYRSENFVIVGDDRETMRSPTIRIENFVNDIEGIWVFSTKRSIGNITLNEINSRILFAKVLE